MPAARLSCVNLGRVVFVSRQLWQAGRVRSPGGGQDLSHPGDDGRLALGCGVLERLILEVDAAHLHGVGIVQKLQRALRLDIPARLHCNCCLAVEHRPFEKSRGGFTICSTFVLQQVAEVFGQLLLEARSRHELGLSELLGRGELNPVGWKAILHEAGSNLLRGGMIAESCYKYCAHGS
jgi:hypothetical protein